MGLPEIVIDLEKIRNNAEVVKKLAVSHGVQVVGVTKGFLAEPKIAEAMLAGGIEILADARIENIERLKETFPEVPLMLLRLPSLSLVDETVAMTDISLNSELEVLQALADEAVRQGKIHKVILMVEVGDLREGVLPEDVPESVKRILGMKGLKFEGLGANFACYGGVIPTDENIRMLVNLTEEIELSLKIKCSLISGGNSANLSLLLEGKLPKRINQLRIGEGIILGTESINGELLPGSNPDTFILRAEVVENWDKPTVPLGETGTDAFGNTPEFTDEGWRRRGIVALGRQDVPPEGIRPRDSRLKIFGASSDHLIIDLTEAPELGVGSVIEFSLQYSGVLGAMTSPYVSKRYSHSKQEIWRSK